MSLQSLTGFAPLRSSECRRGIARRAWKRATAKLRRQADRRAVAQAQADRELCRALDDEERAAEREEHFLDLEWGQP